jgi:hypothetical protein
MGATCTIADLLREFELDILEAPSEDGPGLAQIVNFRDEALCYFITRRPGVVRFRKPVAEGGEVYEVAVRGGLPVACDCPNYRYRRRKAREICKHMACTYYLLYPPFPDC